MKLGTPFGAFLDPVADKVPLTTAVLTNSIYLHLIIVQNEFLVPWYANDVRVQKSDILSKKCPL